MVKQPKNSKKINLSAQVEETLKNRILNLEYPHNYVLVEESLCGEFGISRSPIREALRMLEASDLIHKTSNRSYVVKQISQIGIRELYDLRLALERHVVENLCRREITDDLAQLLLHWQTIDDREGDTEVDYAYADRDFHESLARIYGNKTILDELHHINDRLKVFRTIDLNKSNRIDSTKEQHIDLIKAIYKKDVVKALEYLEINVLESMNNAIESLKNSILRAFER